MVRQATTFVVEGRALFNAKVRVSSPERAHELIDLVAVSVDASHGIVKPAIFSEDFVYRRPATRRVVLTENLVKIADQQGRYAV